MASETAQNLDVIGKMLPDKHARHIVTGKLHYTQDILPGKKLYTRIMTSPYAHANIRSIDTTKAEQLEGVKAVTTYKDNPVLSYQLNFFGDRVAAVAATDPNIAASALELIEVEYEVLDYIIYPQLAIHPGSQATPQGTPPPGVYANEIMSVNRGDINAGFEEAEATVEADVGWTAYYQHSTTETRSATAHWVGDDVYIWVSTQNPFGFRSSVASFLHMPLNRIHIRSHGTGSAMGDKNWGEEATIAAVLAKKAGMPVGCYLSRFENFVQATHQYAVRAHIKVGAKSDGTLTALSGDYVCDLSNALASLGGDTLSCITQNYKCANVKAEVQSVDTNKGHVCWWRCVGEPSGTFLFEQMVDRMAEKLNMDPLSFRLKNAVTRDMPDQDTGKPYGSVAIIECLNKAAEGIDFAGKWHPPGTKTLPDGRMHGIGICGLVCSKGTMAAPRGAIIHLNSDGTAMANFGSSRASCGTNSGMCAIIAETLGMTYDKVSIGQWGDPDVSAYGGYQAGSTMTITLGAGTQVAAMDVRSQMMDVAAKILGVDADQLDAKQNKIFIASDPTKSISIADVMAQAPAPIIGRGYSWGSKLRLSPEAGYPIGTPAEVKTSVASAAEVAVDTETGKVEILNFAVADDMGRAINGFGTRNQIEGGMEIMHGQALLYEQIWDEKNGGACLGYNYLNHLFPTMPDISFTNHKQFIVESIDSIGPYGAKGLGEPPVGTYGSIQSAVYNAIGKWVVGAPLFPQKILAALGKA